MTAQDRQARRQHATNSRTWRLIRASVLAGEPLCRNCASRGITTAANEVDHIDGNSWHNDDGNLQPLCKPCHSSKTAGRADKGCGIDGTPYRAAQTSSNVG